MIIPEHYFDCKLVEVLIDMIQDTEQRVFTAEEVPEVFYFISINFPDEEITLEDVEKFYNATNEEVDLRVHMNALGINY